jgi:hypothetical protein
VFGVCVLALARHFGAVDQDRCIDSDSSGQVLIGELPDGNYRLLGIPNPDEGLGAQWVGADGGTGDEREAYVVRARAGRLSTVNPIRLDPAGTIAGVITEAQTGNPVRVGDVCPTPLPGLRVICADGSGRYELSGLGPYRWPVLYPASYLAPYAWEWSGGASDRYAATPIQVVAGQTVVHDVRMRPAARLTGHVLNPDGTVFTGSGEVQAYNARTGDLASQPDFPIFDGSYTLIGMGNERVRLRLLAEGAVSWYDRATTFDDATPVRVQIGGTTPGIDITTATR